MGYTHYYEGRRAFTDDEWGAIRLYAECLFDASPMKLADGLATPDSEPIADAEHVWFNGAEPNNYETFRLPKNADDPFAFCKTGFSEIRRYDFMVKAILLMAHNVAPDALGVSSDGFDFEWEDALAFANEQLGGGLVLPPAVAGNEGFYEAYRSGPKYEEAKAEYLANKAES